MPGKISEQRKQNARKWAKDHHWKPPSRKGTILTEEQKRVISERSKRLGLKPPSNKGKPMSAEQKEKLRAKAKERWDKIGRKTYKRSKHKTDGRYIDWRTYIFERDSYTCQVCNKVGGVLNAHHIKQWAYYPELRYEVNNGITLCADCHKVAHKIWSLSSNKIKHNKEEYTK